MPPYAASPRTPARQGPRQDAIHLQDQTEPIGLMGTQTASPTGPGPGSVEEPDFGAWLPSALMVLGVSLATWMMVRMLIRRRKRLPLTPGTPHERLEAIREQARKRAQLQAFGAEVHELVERLAAQLDNKAARMELLLQDADERIRKLERMQRIERKRVSAESERASDPTSGHESDPVTDPVTDRVYELADQGEKPVEIAKQLNQHVGQVELILALRRA